MANQFVRFPTEGGDDNTWAPFEEAQNKTGVLGVYSAHLYNDSGALKLTKGRIGINDGTNIGTVELDTIETIDIAGISNSNWAQVEMAVSGTGVSFSVSDIVGGTDASSLPAAFTASYNPEKAGYYINATKRTIGLIWKNASGTLEGIINDRGGNQGYCGFSIGDDANDNYYSFENTDSERVDFKRAMYLASSGTISIKKVYTKIIEIGDWNMDSNNSIGVAHKLDLNPVTVMSIRAVVRRDDALYYSDFAGSNYDNAETNTNVAIEFNTAQVVLSRAVGGRFDDLTYSSTSYNRGWIIIEYYED